MSLRWLAIPLAAGVLAMPGAVAPEPASSTPVFVRAATDIQTGLRVKVWTRPQYRTRCKVNLFTSVFDYDGRRVAGLGRQSVNGCARNVFSAVVPTRSLRRGQRYVVCVWAANSANNGRGIRHRSCRRFRGR